LSAFSRENPLISHHRISLEIAHDHGVKIPVPDDRDASIGWRTLLRRGPPTRVPMGYEMGWDP
jgi:hypothetical protein